VLTFLAQTLLTLDSNWLNSFCVITDPGYYPGFFLGLKYPGMRIRCRAFFDITRTEDVAGWHRARNQQRNWETVNQVISLRTLPEEIVPSKCIEQDGQRAWQFDFVVNNPASIELDGNPVGVFESDSRDVPMLVGLDETHQLDDRLLPGVNIMFEVI
jgi:hypothetical protein